MLAGLGVHILLRWKWDPPLWLQLMAITAVVVGSASVFLAANIRMAMARSFFGCALLFAACQALTPHRVDFMPWFAILGIGYPLLFGFARSFPTIIALNSTFLLVGWNWFGWSSAMVRVVSTVGGGVLAGLIADARTEALAAESRATADAFEATSNSRRLRAIIDAAPVGIMMVDRQYNASSNALMGEFLGAENEPTRAGLDANVHVDDRPKIEYMINSLLHGHTTTQIVRAIHRDLGPRLTEITAAPIFDNDGLVSDSVIILRDIQAQFDNQRQLERFRILAETTSDVIGISSISGRGHYLNPAGERFFGTTARSVGELLPHIPVEYRSLIFNDARAAIERRETWMGELELIDCNGERQPMSAVIMGVRDREGILEAYAVSYRDLTDRRELEAQLAFEARHDLLTGLPNRQQLLERLEVLLATQQRVAVMFCDLDGFKVVNDSLGHEMGDRLLKVVADRLRFSAREGDVVGRLGGDEFLLICRHVATADEITAVADRLLDTIGAPIRLNNRDHVVTFSIGVALADSDTTTASDLLQRADLAMYASKQSGRGKVTMFDEEMRIRADDRLNTERELRVALDGGQLEVRYQPIVSLPDRMPLGFEALVRWRHPTRGLLAPAQFLGVAEATGLTVRLGEEVFAEACRATAELRLRMPHLSMSINLSAVQLADEGLVDHVARAITRAGITAAAITVEITEEIAMYQLEAAQSKLDDLRSLGVRLAIDDFGTGHSNLALLRKLSADFVKIDRSLIDGLGTIPGDTQLVRMILSLTEELGFAPVAEGVSTEVQLAELVRLRCRLAQGHLFAEPLTLVDALDYVSQASDQTVGVD